ncbi:MAG: diaminopimelate epimerase [Candidatus Cloacimonadaceae bacterium]|jgi:diaminopimelate epimerase|nr:diaminopimelate epimerase [Candidatus Cloacimonadota bacterium]MCB5257961.1 diaminopimelate epimerase [Candidatus Cloacimonadota bacterium]MDY0111517.1 diaminopimelate epimerase [Candidatus Syntrophosphaera sp.]
MLIPFCKLEAQGNDFVILELIPASNTRLPLNLLAKDICKVHQGVGADGLVILLASDSADGKMIIYNKDGSRAEMCGSALRCCAYLLSDLTNKKELKIETDSGIKTASIKDKAIQVNLGRPSIIKDNILVEEVKGTLVEIGNIHFVSYQDVLDGQELYLGPTLEKHSAFHAPVNVEFVHPLSATELEMKVWEKGVGLTQACGTGAVASVFTGIIHGILSNEVKVNMPGGQVLIRKMDTGDFLLEGNVTKVFNGVYKWKI